ncbi:hypothetical protein K493DRAFT_411035, partial [Basidiobolus meristosporus CBS 931.73]
MPTEFGLRNKEIKVTFGRRNKKPVPTLANLSTHDDTRSTDPEAESVESATVDKSESVGKSETNSNYASLIKRTRERKQVSKDKEGPISSEAEVRKKPFSSVKRTTQSAETNIAETTSESSSGHRGQVPTTESKAYTTDTSEKGQNSLEDIFASFLGNPTLESTQDTTPKNSPARSKIAHSLKRAHTDSEYATPKTKRTNLFGSFHEEEGQDTWTPVIFTDRISVRSNMSASQISKLSVADIMKSDIEVTESEDSKKKESHSKAEKPSNANSHEKDVKTKGKKSSKVYRQKRDDTPESTSNLSPPTFSRAKTDLDATPRKSILARKQHSPHTPAPTTPSYHRAKTLPEGDSRWDDGSAERDLIDDDDDQTATDLKSQHELRELGESKRFNDEMEYVLGGLDPEQSLSVRRTSCLELTRKLLSGSFSMKLRAHNFIPKIYELLREQNDTTILSCRAFMLYLLTQDKRNLEFLPLEDHCLELLGKLLTVEPDPLVQPNWGSTKSEKRLIKELRELVATSKPVLPEASISVKSLAARTLLSIVSRKSRNDEVTRTRVRESGILDIVCRILEEDLMTMNQQLNDANQPKLDYETLLESAPYLRILENATQFCPANQDAVALYKNLFRRLLILALFFQVEGTSGSPQKAIQAMDSISGVLRLLINLTNEHEKCSHLVSEQPGLSVVMRLISFSQSNKIESSDTGINETLSASRYDVTLLSIGLLINIVDASEECKDIIRETEFCPNESCHT